MGGEEGGRKWEERGGREMGGRKGEEGKWEERGGREMGGERRKKKGRKRGEGRTKGESRNGRRRKEKGRKEGHKKKEKRREKEGMEGEVTTDSGVGVQLTLLISNFSYINVCHTVECLQQKKKETGSWHPANTCALSSQHLQ